MICCVEGRVGNLLWSRPLGKVADVGVVFLPWWVGTDVSRRPVVADKVRSTWKHLRVVRTVDVPCTSDGR